jgi:hypothetical protein
MKRVKRTYNLSPETVLTVRELADEAHVAPTQDAVVERAIQSLARQVRDREHTRQFAACAQDPEFVREMEEIGAEFEHDDRAAWERV